MKITISSVSRLLNKHKVKFDEWGSGTSHPLSELVRRLKTENMTLAEDDFGRLVLTMRLVVVHLYYKGRLGKKVLFEDRQLFHQTGRVLRRRFRGIGETLHRNENPLSAGERALREELSQSQPKFCDPKNYPQLTTNGRRYLTKPGESKKWPGLRVRLDRTHFSTTIGHSLYLKQYSETTYIFGGRPFKTTTFLWRDLPSKTS